MLNSAIVNILGDKMMDSFVQRACLEKNNVEGLKNPTYLYGLKSMLTGLFDDFIVDHLSDKELIKVIEMSGSEHEQKRVKFIQQKIPHFSQELEKLFQSALKKELA